MTDDRKQCTKCKRIKPVDQFYSESPPRVGLRAWCKVCTLLQNRMERRTEKMMRWRREYEKRRRKALSQEKKQAEANRKKTYMRKYRNTVRGKLIQQRANLRSKIRKREKAGREIPESLQNSLNLVEKEIARVRS